MDANSPLDHYQNSWILLEAFIVSSQPSLLLLDMENEKTQEIEMVVKQVEKESAEKIEKAVELKKEKGLQIDKSMKLI